MTNAAVVGTARGAVQAAAREIMVDFRVLGPLEAVAAGGQLDLGAPKQRALLALLVSQAGQPVAVDVLLEALWAGHPPPSAMTSLQAYVANLRRALEPDRPPRAPATVLRTCPGGYLLDSRMVDVDVHRFGARAKAGWQASDRGDPHQALIEFEACLALWRGQAYAEVTEAACVVPEVARLEELRLSVVEARCAALLAVGSHGVAVAELEAFIQAHPLREYGYELLSLALYRAGRQADALGVLRTVQKKLAEELGIDPRPSLQTLEREILNQDPALDWHPTPAAPTLTVPTAPPRAAADVPAVPGPDGLDGSDRDVFVGREAALRQLAEALAAAGAGHGRVVTVSGEPGIGKTSLLRRFADLAGVPVLWGTCPEHVSAPPLWLWEQVLRAAGAAFPGHPVPPQVAELLEGDTERLVGGGDLLRRFEAIVHYLTGASPTAPLVVLLDHLHRADPSSQRLLAHLAESVPASRLLLAVSYRSGEEESLAETLAALARAGITRIALGGLDVADTHTLANTLLDKEISRSTAEGLWARTEGNPFFLRELTKLLTSEQRLEQPNTAPVPVAVRDVVLRRVARLPHTAAEVLSVAAVAGRHFDIEVVAEAASVELEAALKTLDTAVAAGVITEDQRRLGWFRFTHTMVAEALYETAGRLRRTRLHRRIGVAASRAWAGNTERAAEIARHWLLAAELDPTAAAHACTHAAAAARAADGLAPADTASLWRQAVAAADLACDDELDRHPLLTGLGGSLYRAGSAREGLACFVQAIEETLATPGVRGDGDSARLVAAAVAAVSGPDWYPDSAGLVGVLERALPQVSDPGRRAVVLACLAVTGGRDGDPAARAALSDEALALVRPTGDTAALADVLALRAVALAGPANLDERLHALTELLSLPKVAPRTVARARRLRAFAFAVSGRVTEMVDELDLAGELADERFPVLRAQLDWVRAAVLMARGRRREADGLSRAAHDRHARMAWGAPRLARAAQRWQAAFFAGAVADLADELRAIAASIGALQGNLALALLDAGEEAEARAVLARIPTPVRDDRWLHARCWALLAAARLGEREPMLRLRAELLPHRELTSSLPDVVIGGPVAYFTAEAALALGDPEAAAADLVIATETARRMGARPWQLVVDDAVQRCPVPPGR